MACACHRKHNQIDFSEGNFAPDISRIANLIPQQATRNPNCAQPCTINPRSGCSRTPCECIPIEQPAQEPQYQMCCDQNGCCKLYSKCCRNTFWPEFSHPRWLCCDILYCLKND